MHKSFRHGIILTGAMALPVLASDCSAVADAQQAICCTEYQPGADMLKTDFKVDASIKGSFTAFAAASGDIATIGAASVADVTSACRAIATDLGVVDSPDAGAAGLGGQELMNFWCGKATAQIQATFAAVGVAKGQLNVEYDPPQCSMSVSAQADCEGSCNVSGQCDLKANPPRCEGGKLEIDCKGGCNVSATAPSIDCTGTCSGNCSGSCVAQGGVAVDCDGSCDGTCAAGGTANGTGIQADGSCKGTCSGKCTLSATAPKVACKGTCSGTCDAKCTAAPGQASVKCSGTCDADYQPLECTGGKLEGGCQVDANCHASCNARAQAKASCSEPKLTIGFKGAVTAGMEAKYQLLMTTLEVNLPKLFVIVEGRASNLSAAIQALANVGTSLIGSGKLDLHALGCANLIGTSVQSGLGNFNASVSASASVIGTVK